ncbi:MAG: hypothetical protein FGM15_03690 [Chthoniobacterales bacterium]|nr:hypothetical protein [Chthoniobacterales bacterium]
MPMPHLKIGGTQMKMIRLALLAAAVFCGPQSLPAAPPYVQILPDSGELQPGSTLEFRFAEPVISSEDLGPAKDSPVVFDPALPGTFTWLSTRSGVFVPDGPLPLGGRWTARLREGPATADKKPAASWRAELSTPPFGVTAVSDGVWNKDEVPADVIVKLAFQLPVKAEAEFFGFTDNSGREVPAEVRHARNFNVAADAGDWNMRWQLIHDPSADEDQEEFPARLIVTPAVPLPAGTGWKLVVKAGLPAQSGTDKLAEPYAVQLGTVPPFTLKKSEAANYINSGPTLHLEFTGALAPDITPETAGKFFHISPAPADLGWEIDYDTATARGAFETGKDYTLAIGKDVCSAVGQPFDGEREQTVQFAPVLPRIYLPELTMSQILGGRRKLPVRSVNLASIRVKATLLPPLETAKALSIFEENRWKYSDGEPVPVEDFKGRVLCDETVAPPDTQIDRKQTIELDWDRLLGGKKAGAVLIELQGDPLPGAARQRPAAQALVQITDFGILWQKTGATVRTHVFSTATTAPVGGASTRLLDGEFKTAAAAKTDRQGNAALEFDTVPAWLVVESGEDACVLRMGPEADALRIGEWYSATWSPGTRESSLRAMMFTDRPLYQPGETAHLKGLVRRIDKGAMALAEGQTAMLVLRGPEYNEVLRQEVETDAKGAFDSDLAIPAAPLGNYTLQLASEGGGPIASASFIVAEYQPDAFEVNIDMPEDFAAGSPAPKAAVDGRYFFGGRLTDADVRWTLRYVRQTFAPEGFEKFSFIGPEEEDAKPLTLRGDTKITGTKPATIEPVLPTPEGAPYRGILTAEVTDINQQTVTGAAEFTRQASDFYLGIAQDDERVIRLGEEIPLQVVAVQPDGKPFAGPVALTVSIKHWRYHVVRVQGAGGAVTFRRETVKEPVAEMKAATVAPVRTPEGWSAGKQESLRFKAATLGHHQVRVTARDKTGRTVSTETSFYVSGEGETVWDYRNPWEVTLVPDKTSYLPGETARILVQTPIAGKAFVSIERGDTILRNMQIELTGNAPVIEIPVGEDDAPNVDMSVVILRGADGSPRKFPAPDFRFGSCSLKVEQPGAHLRVEVSPERPKVQPGEDIVTTVTVTDHKGKPVGGAGVTFYAVDDGVLALTGFKRPDPADIFLAPVASRVLTGLSLAQLLPEDPNDLEFGNKGYLIGGGGEEGPVSLRENFPGTACWLPSLATGNDGKVTARFTAPDALTRYRLVAVATSGPLASGSGESGVNISRPLMILPALGQFANAGDKLTARAVVRNETGVDGSVEITLSSPAGKNSASLEIPSGESRAADFPLSFSEPGTADLEWSATLRSGSTSFSDRVKTALPVRSPMLQLRETYFMPLDGKSNNLLEGVNPQLAEGRGTVDVTVANTRLAGLGEQARFLVEYPYGCVEQTSSALVPWLMMPALGPLMPGFARDAEETRRVVNATVAEIFEFQTSDGGLAFWQGGRQSAPFPSAWAAIVLARAAAQDVKMPGGWSKLLDYLAGSMRGLADDDSAGRLSEKVYAAYALALAGRAEASYHEELFRRRAELPAEARCILALAIMQADGPREMAAKLLKTDKAAPEDVSPFGGAARDRAIHLLAWTHYEPKNSEVARLLAEVLAFGPANRDGTTQSCAWTLLALADYRVKVEGKDSNRREARGTIVAAAESVPFAVSAKTPAFGHTFPLTPGNQPGALSVDNPSAAPLYGEARFAVYPPLGEQPRQDRGFAVSRSYRKIAGDGSLQPAENLRVGDRLVVTLRVETTRPAWFVAIDDPLPSILEAVNPDFVSRDVGGAANQTPWLVSHSETRSDRVLYFCDAMPAGGHTFTYLARVRMAGEATAGATKAESMYRPERFGLGEISRLTSLPAGTP